LSRIALWWKAWTEPEHLMKWFTPRPWQTVECEIDLWPGGMFRTVMQSPEGERTSGVASCYLEVVENRRLVWTTALEPGYRPAPSDPDTPFVFTAAILIEPAGTGTKYTAIARHRDEGGCKAHETMGFHEGWGKAVDQLVEVAQTI
jgi:uncharacterized protein YndB with AHSA1/START domain